MVHGSRSLTYFTITPPPQQSPHPRTPACPDNTCGKMASIGLGHGSNLRGAPSSLSLPRSSTLKLSPTVSRFFLLTGFPRPLFSRCKQIFSAYRLPSTAFFSCKQIFSAYRLPSTDFFSCKQIFSAAPLQTNQMQKRCSSDATSSQRLHQRNSVAEIRNYQALLLPCSYTIRFVSAPSFSISTVTISPGLRYTCFSGGYPRMTPSGVPVRMTSPGTRVMCLDR